MGHQKATDHSERLKSLEDVIRVDPRGIFGRFEGVDIFLGKDMHEAGDDVFTIVNAFPTPSGDHHVGHIRGNVIADVLRRYKELRGIKTFLPYGIHATGKDVFNILDRLQEWELDGTLQPLYQAQEKLDSRVRSRDLDEIAIVKDPKYGIPIKTIRTILDKLAEAKGKKYEAASKIKSNAADLVIEYFRTKYLQNLQSLGCRVDAEAFFATKYNGFKSFVKWQMKRAKEAGVIGDSKRPTPYCRACGDTVEIETSGSEAIISGMVIDGKRKRPIEPKDIRPQKYTILTFADQRGRIIPVATTRPETVFGATNLWFSPDGEYSKVSLRYLMSIDKESGVPTYSDNQKTVIVATDALPSLETYLGHKVIKVEQFPIDKFAKLVLSNPITGDTGIRMLPEQTSFLSTYKGTGIVMSVPSLDPYDFVNVSGLSHIIGLPQADLEIIVDREGKSLSIFSNPQLAGDILNAINDSVLMHQIRNEMYKTQERGFMSSAIEIVAGKRVGEGREELLKTLLRKGFAAKYAQIDVDPRVDFQGDYPFAYCKTHPDQALVYTTQPQPYNFFGDKGLQRKARRLIRDNLRVTPDSYKRELLGIDSPRRVPGTIRSLEHKSASREATGIIGTMFPDEVHKSNKKWRVEALTDSTLYMEFYLVSKWLNTQYAVGIDETTSQVSQKTVLRLENLKDEFFDYIFLGKGTRQQVADATGLESQTLAWMKMEVDRHYQHLTNIAGTEHNFSHFPYFLLHHAGILPEKYFPKQLISHGLIMRRTDDGQIKKMGKSLGNAIPLEDAIKDTKPFFAPLLEYGFSENSSVDLLRMFMMNDMPVEEAFVWNDGNCAKAYRSIVSSLKGTADLIKQIRIAEEGNRTYLTDEYNNNEGINEKDLDAWLDSRLNSIKEEYEQLMENNRFRMATIQARELSRRALKEYLNLGGRNVTKLNNFLEEQIRMWSPFMPAISRDLSGLLNDTVSLGEYQPHDPNAINIDLEVRINYRTDEQKKKFFEAVGRPLAQAVGYARGNNFLLETEENVIEIYVGTEAEKRLIVDNGNIESIVSYCKKTLRIPGEIIDVDFEVVVDGEVEMLYILINPTSNDKDSRKYVLRNPFQEKNALPSVLSNGKTNNAYDIDGKNTVKIYVSSEAEKLELLEKLPKMIERSSNALSKQDKQVPVRYEVKVDHNAEETYIRVNPHVTYQISMVKDGTSTPSDGVVIDFGRGIRPINMSKN